MTSVLFLTPVSPLESWRISMNYITRELDPIYQ